MDAPKVQTILMSRSEDGTVGRVTIPPHQTIGDMMDQWEMFLLAMGYHPDSIAGYLRED